MKKIILIILLSMVLVGCSSDKVKVADDILPVTVENGEQKSDNAKPKETNKYYFDGEIAEIQDLKIKITKTKVIQPGEDGNEYGDVPVFAIWYEATNKSDKEVDAGTAWIVIFEAIQDNNKNFVNTLEMSSLPDDKFLDMVFKNIKQDGTVEYAIGYELDDDVTPVTLVATRGIGGEEIGRHDYKVD